MAPGSTSPPKLCPILTKRLHVPHAPPLSALEGERVPTVLPVAIVMTIVRRRAVHLITSGPNLLVLEEADPGIKGRGDGSYNDEKLVVWPCIFDCMPPIFMSAFFTISISSRSRTTCGHVNIRWESFY